MWKPYETAGGEPGGSGCYRVTLNDDVEPPVVCVAALDDAPEPDADYFATAVVHADGRIQDPRLGWFTDLVVWGHRQRREAPARRRRWEARAGSRGPRLAAAHGALAGVAFVLPPLSVWRARKRAERRA